MADRFPEMFALIRNLAIAGNAVFVLWILYNGVNEGFQGTPLEIISYIGLMILLSVNSLLLYGSKRNS